MKSFLKSLGKSILEALAKNQYITNWRKRYPAFFGFLEKRLSLSRPYGFYFSLGVIFSAVAFFYFLVLAQDILAKDPFIEADIRLMNLVAALRSVAVAKVLLAFTYLGNWQFLVSLGAIAAVILILLKEKRQLIYLAIGLAGGGLLDTVLKLLLHRTRPALGFSLIPVSGYAFPSWHATLSIIFYGMICYGIIKILKRRWLKLFLAILTLILIFFIGFSRIYLGVHWVSDVLAGWSLGLAFLILLMTFFKQAERFTPEIKINSAIPKKFIFFITIALLIFEGVFFYYFYIKHPLVEPKKYQPKIIAVAATADFPAIVLADNFPKFSETIVGEKMEPINFIMVGSREQIINIYNKAGWYIADEPNHLKNLYQLVIAAIFNRPYPTAPVTPSFLDAQPNSIAFEKSTATNTVRQRHHTRFWLTNFKQGGVPVWVATASFDDGLRYYITHKIHPDVDTERELINSELIGTGLVKEEKQIQLVKPFMGQNQSGDQFFTDGKAYIILFK